MIGNDWHCLSKECSPKTKGLCTRRRHSQALPMRLKTSGDTTLHLRVCSLARWARHRYAARWHGGTLDAARCLVGARHAGTLGCGTLDAARCTIGARHSGTLGCGTLARWARARWGAAQWHSGARYAGRVGVRCAGRGHAHDAAEHFVPRSTHRIRCRVTSTLPGCLAPGKPPVARKIDLFDTRSCQVAHTG